MPNSCLKPESSPLAAIDVPTTFSPLDTNHPSETYFHSSGGYSYIQAEVGDVLGKYELVGRLGRGSTSVVFLGRHRKLLFPVAVKVLDRSTISHLTPLLGQLVSEAVMLAQLNHPNIVRLWDLDDEADCPYLVLEYVPGGTLAELIHQKGPIPIPFAFAIVRQVVEGLAEAHKLGIVHRDVKPGNFLLARDGHVKVADLGLAVVMSDRCGQPDTAEHDDCFPVGTAAYMAPEQVNDPAGADFRADIYSLGATLWHALTGRPLFEGRTTLEIIMKHLQQPPAAPGELVPGLSQECSALILRMLAKRPEDRFGSYDELRVALAHAIGDRRAPRPLAEAFLSFAAPKP